MTVNPLGGGAKLTLFPGILQAQLDRAVRGWLTGTVAKGERYAKERTPVDTGRLRASISGQVRDGGGGPVGAIGTNVDYAAPVEFGARGRNPVGMLRGGAEQAVQEETS